MKEKLVTVAQFTDQMEADFARQWFDDEGIGASVVGRNVGTASSGMPAAVDIQLHTPESRTEETPEILEARPRLGQGPDSNHHFEEERE